MNYLLVIAGQELYLNEFFLHYIFRCYKEHFNEIPLVYYIGDTDKELPFKLENYAKNFTNITIIANENKFNTISKMLCTLSSDFLELKENTLMPSKADTYIQDSFVMQLNNAKINLIKAEPTKKIPEFLLENKEKIIFFNLLNIDDKSVQMILKPFANTYNISICTSLLLQRLVFVKATNQKFGQMENFISEVKKVFSTQFIDDKSIINFVAKNLIRKKLKISFAESCTCGLIASKFGEISGISEIFHGSIVSYSNEIKHTWLEVDNDIFAKQGAVSQECVVSMANGAREISGADFGIAVSGIAGPLGGSKDKPVGLVYIAVCNKNRFFATSFNFDGDRNYIREQSMLATYFLLLKTFWEEIVM